MSFDPTRPYFYEHQPKKLTKPADDAPTMAEAVYAAIHVGDRDGAGRDL